MIGLTFSERMAGTWHRLDAPAEEKPIEFRAQVTVPSLKDFLGNTVARLHGTVLAEGLTRGAKFEGTLGLGELFRERRLPYHFTFRGDDGRDYHFDGTKEVSLLDLPRSMTTLPGYLHDDAGHEVGRAVLRFDLRSDLVSFLRSWKPVWR